jgi:hypothetical protein
MGEKHGSIGETTKIVDHGPNHGRWNLVILGDGYRESEIGKYHTDVQTFVETLHTTAPFDELWPGINIHRIDVTSSESGADDPANCPDKSVSASDATPNTFFDATFCSEGPGGVRLARLLTIDSTLAQKTASERVREVHQALVIVNLDKYGGSGGKVAICSAEKTAAEIAIHEIGHSYFDLADEYGGDGTGTPKDEPPKANATRNIDRATHKWGALIDAATPIPTSPEIAPPPGIVGAYEGAMYSDVGVYRPLPDCKMRTLGVAFCPVCAGAIRAALAQFLPVSTPPNSSLV